jgi:cytochrome c biogenesis protein CcdA
MFLFIRVGHSIEPVVIEFLYYIPTCPGCDPIYHEVYDYNRQVLINIQYDYGSKVLIKYIEFFSLEGQEKVEQYHLGPDDWNSIVVNYAIVLSTSGGKQYVNETYLRELIDFYLGESPQVEHNIAILSLMPSQTSASRGEKVNLIVTVANSGMNTESFNVSTYYNETLIETQTVTSLSPNASQTMVFVWDTTNKTLGNYIIKAKAELSSNETDLSDNERTCEIKVKESSNSPEGLMAILTLAITLGFFETFSPCVMIMLSFILSYTISKTTGFKSGFLQVMTFGAGFLSAAAILGLAFGMLFLSMATLRYYLTWIVCIFAIIFGLSLLGILKAPFETKPLIKKLARKYAFTYVGLIILGFIFYFLDPCIAPIFVSMVPVLFSGYLILILLVFCIGAVIPFIGIGLFAGSISKLVRSTYRHQFIIRAISGLLLIGYALYLIFLILH